MRSCTCTWSLQDQSVTREFCHDEFGAGLTRSFAGTFTASSNLPIGAGLGSSAAFSTTVASALLLAHKHLSVSEASGISAKDTDLVDGWAFLAEKVLHGNPSGIDNAVSVRGGAVAFTRSFGGKSGGLEALNG